MLNKHLFQYFTFLFLIWIPSTVSFSVSVEECTGDIDNFDVNSLVITCDDDDYCTWGSYGTFAGSYTLGDYVSTSTPIISATIWGVTVYDETVDICDNGNIYDDYGNYCPDAGTYQYVAQTELPGSPSSWYTSFSSWFSFHVYVTIDFGDETTFCDVKIEGSNDNSSSSYMIVGSTMAFVGFMAFRMRKRYIIVSEDDQDGNGYGSHFVKMPSL